MKDAFSAREGPATSHLGQTSRLYPTSEWQRLPRNLEAVSVDSADLGNPLGAKQSAALWDQQGSGSTLNADAPSPPGFLAALMSAAVSHSRKGARMELNVYLNAEAAKHDAPHSRYHWQKDWDILRLNFFVGEGQLPSSF